MTGRPDPDRDAAQAATLARLLAALTEDFDVLDLLDGLVDECVPLLAVHAAGLLLGDRAGGLHVVASSEERPELVTLFEAQAEQGPCRDCVRTGTAVTAADLADPDTDRRWPRFAARARAEGVHAVHALPMRLPTRTVGALNLLDTDARHLDPTELRAAQALADAATVGILTERGERSGAAVLDRLRTTIAGRVVVEQAKGVLAERGGLDIAEAAARLRDHGRRTGSGLVDVAHRILDGTLDSAVVLRSADGP